MDKNIYQKSTKEIEEEQRELDTLRAYSRMVGGIAEAKQIDPYYVVDKNGERHDVTSLTPTQIV